MTVWMSLLRVRQWRRVESLSTNFMLIPIIYAARLLPYFCILLALFYRAKWVSSLSVNILLVFF